MKGHVLVAEAAKRCGCSGQAVRNWILAGILPAKLVVGRYFIPEAALMRLLK